MSDAKFMRLYRVRVLVVSGAGAYPTEQVVAADNRTDAETRVHWLAAREGLSVHHTVSVKEES